MPQPLHHAIAERKDFRVPQMITLYESGVSLAEVGRQYGISGQRVGQLFKRHGHPRRTPTRYTDTELIDHLRALALRLDRTPSRVDLVRAEGPSPGPYIRRFGSLRAAQQRAGLVPNKRGYPAAAHA